MGVVRLGRRSFGLVVAVLLSVALYFQAAGAAELVVARTLFEAGVATPGAVRQGSPRPPAARRSTSGDAILAFNPFDSVTGPLDRGASTLAIPGATQPFPGLDDPLNAPPCPGVSVSIVTQSTDPEWSIAQLAGPGDGDASARRVGDRVGQLEVLYIGFDSARLSPAVWLSSEKNLCHVLLFGEKRDEAAKSDTLPPAPGTRAPAEDERGRRHRIPRASSVAALPPGIADRIQRVSETEFAIDRSVIDDVLENQAQLIASTRIVPEQRDGKTIGVRLFGIRSDTLLGTLGLQNGDRLESINGHDVADPAKALEAYAGLPTASSISVQLTRRGQPTRLEIQIR